MMKESKKRLKGSPFRDAFKKWHKEFGPSWAYGIDIDFALVEFEGNNNLRVFLDSKRPDDEITDTERKAYDDLVFNHNKPVYIITIYGNFKSKTCPACGIKIYE